MAGPGNSSHGSLACGLGHPQGPLEATLALPSPGPARPFRPISQFLSFTFNSFDIWKASPTHTHNGRCQASEEGSLLISIPYQASVPSRGTHWRPACPQHTQTPQGGREGGGLQLPVGTGPTSAWVLVVRDGPWGRRTRACGQRGLWQPGLRPARGAPCRGAPRMSRIQGKGRSQRPRVRRASVARSQQR